jgi:hypothetical protein
MNQKEFDEAIKKIEGCCGGSAYDSISQPPKYNKDEIYDLLYYIITEEEFKDQLPILSPMIKLIYYYLKHNL